MDVFQFDDPAWVEDYQRALGELVEDQKLLPPPERKKPEHFWTVAGKEERDVEELSGSALRLYILEHMGIRRTAHPMTREIHWQDAVIGEVAQSPYQPLCWVSSRDKRILHYSLREAAVFTVAAHLGKVDGSV